MADGRSQAAWAHTASLMALLANIHWGSPRHIFTPDDFLPEKRAGGGRTLRHCPLSMLAKIMGGRRRRQGRKDVGTQGHRHEGTK
jgi:hypothetical protein